jgi:hypothetical protein
VPSFQEYTLVELKTAIKGFNEEYIVSKGDSVNVILKGKLENNH